MSESSEVDFSSDDSTKDKDYVVPKKKRLEKVYKKGNTINDMLFKEYFEIVKKVIKPNAGLKLINTFLQLDIRNRLSKK